MTARSPFLPDRVARYLDTVGWREHPVLADLRCESDALPQGRYRIAPETAQLLAFLVELTEACRMLEVGTFTGYAALAAALAMPPEGRIVTLDANAEWTAIARRFWAEAGVEERIELRLGLAEEGLAALAEERAPPFDLALIDADKRSTRVYYEHALRLVRPGGLILVDNTLWGGAVADPASHEKHAETFRTFNRLLHDDPRVSVLLLPIGDGLTLARRRA